MFQTLLIFTIAIGVGLGASGNNSGGTKIILQDAKPAMDSLPDGTESATTSLLDGIPETDVDDVQDGWQPEPQVATGKFTTAIEVKPILTMTKPNWAALREYEGQDILYLTNLLAWRCGLHEIRYAINEGQAQVWQAEECHIDTGQPNALTMKSHLPYVSFGLGTVNSVSVMLVYDDGSKDSAHYQRSDILMP